MGFHVNELEELVAAVKKHHGKTLNLAITKIPIEFYDSLRAAIRDAVNDFLKKQHIVPFQTEFKNLLASHGPRWRNNYQQQIMRHRSDPIVFDEDNETEWVYKNFHFVWTQCENNDTDEKQQESFIIHGLFRRMPNFANVVIEYHENFELPETQCQYMDLLLTVISGEITVSLNNQNFKTLKNHNIYIRKDFCFSYSVPENGATIQLMAFNTNITQIGDVASEAIKESETVEARKVE
eukprot:UN02508